MRAALAISLVIVATATVPARADTGPAGVLALAVDPVATNVVYAASPQGLYISDNGGMRWTRAGSLPDGPVPNVALAPNDPRIVYAIAGGVVFKSADRGTTWSSTGQAGGPVLVADVYETSTLYVTGAGGDPNLLKSFDGGSTWIPVPIVDTDASQPGATLATTVSRLLLDPNAADVLYAVARTDVTLGGTTTSYEKVFKSFTGGAYWQAIPIGGTNLAISPHTSELFYSVGDEVHVSSDGGLTSRLAFVTFLRNDVASPPRAIAFNRGNRHALYVATDGTWFIRDVLLGGFWSTGTPARTAALDVIAADPASPDTLYAGSSCGWPSRPLRACVPVIKSFDGGRTWRNIAKGYHEPQLIKLEAHSDLNLSAVFIETVAGRPSYRVAESRDGGATWTRTSEIESLTEGLASPDGVRTRYASLAALPRRMLHRDEASNVFQPFSTNPAYNPLPSDLTDVDTGGSGSDEHFFAAFDGGPSGTRLYEHAVMIAGRQFAHVADLPDLRLTGLYRTRGSAWFRSTLFITGTYDGVADRVIRGTVGFFGWLLQPSFELLPFTPDKPIRAMTFGNSPVAATGTPGARDGQVFESHDEGATWTQLGAADVLFDIQAIETVALPGYTQDDLYLADADRGVFVYRRGTNTWESLGFAGATMLSAGYATGVPVREVLYAATPSGAVWRVTPGPYPEMQLNASSPAAGSPITFGGSGTGGLTPREYRFRRYDPAVGWLLVQDYSLSSTYTWTPTDADTGSHMIEIAVRAVGADAAELVEYTEFYVEPRRDRVVAIPFRHNADVYSDVFVYDRVTGTWNIQDGTAAGQFTAGPSGGWAPGWDISVADFNADGLDDFFLYASASGVWFKAINAGSGFSYFSQGWHAGMNILPLDLNGDGRDDIFAHNPGTGTGFACISVGDGTGGFNCTPSQWAPGFRAFRADFNADGLDDLFIHRSIGGEYYKLISQGNGSFSYVGGAWAPHWTPTVLDLNGDGRSDVFLYDNTTGVSYRAVSTGDGTGGFTYSVEQWRHGWTVHAADFDLNASGDLFLYDGASWEKVLNDGTAFEHFAGGWARWTIGVTDLNGDGSSDVFLFDPASGQWYQALTTAAGAFAYTNGVFR